MCVCACVSDKAMGLEIIVNNICFYNYTCIIIDTHIRKKIYTKLHLHICLSDSPCYCPSRLAIAVIIIVIIIIAVTLQTSYGATSYANRTKQNAAVCRRFNVYHSTFKQG